MQQNLSDIKDHNTNALLNYKPSLYWLSNHISSTEIEVLTRRKDPTLRVTQNDKKITLHSAFEPQKEAVAWAEAVHKKSNAMYVVFGFGLGYHIRELKKIIDNESTIIVIEPEYDIFCKAIETIDITDIIKDEKIILLVYKEIPNILQGLKGIFNSAVYTGSSVVFSSISPYTILYDDIYREIAKKLDSLHKEAVVSKNTTLFFSGSWQENLMKNLHYILESYSLNGLIDKFKDVPAIIVSAGPSLNKNIHLLKDVGDKAIIISTDTALKALFKNGIKPHFVISIDGSIKNYEKYSGIKYDEIPLIFTPKVHWKIVNNHNGKKLLFSCGDVYTEFLLNKYSIEVEALASGGSVANNAVHFANKLGANPIVFMGQDLAFTNNKSHADGTMYDGKNTVTRDADDMYVKDIYGGEVLTNRSFYIFLKWFEEFIAIDKSDRKYIDSTEGGAYIEGTEVMDLSDCINKFMTKDLNVSQKIVEFFCTNKRIISSLDFDDLKEFIENQKDVFKDISKRCKRAYNICKDILLEYDKALIDSKKVSAYLRKMDKLDKYITEKSEDMILLQHVLEPVIYNTFSSANKDARIKEYENQKEKDIDIIGYSLDLYKGIKGAIDYTLPLLDECINDLATIKKE